MTVTDRALFAEFLTQEGYQLGLTPAAAKELMPTLFSPDSWQRFQNLMAIQQRRPYRADEFYSVVNTLEEFALLLSPQGHLQAQCGIKVLQLLEPIMHPNIRIADFGCGVGSFSRFLATHYSNCQVCGIDRHAGLLAIARQSTSLPHVNFWQTDFADISNSNVEKRGSYDVGVALLGMDLEPEPWVPNRKELMADDPATLQLTNGYRQTSYPLFKGWRRAIRKGGQIFAAFALLAFEPWYGCMLGALDAGYGIDLSQCTLVPANNLFIPIMTFDVVGDLSTQPDLDVLLNWWIKQLEEHRQNDVLSDVKALAKYRSLPRRNTLDCKEEKFEDGHFMQEELGLWKNGGYIFKYSTTGYRHLELVAADKLKGEDKPIYVYDPLDIS